MNLRFPSIVGEFLGSRATGVFSRKMELESFTEEDPKPAEWARNFLGKMVNIFPPLWNLGVHYHLHKSLPLVPVLRQTNPVQALASYFRSILRSFSHLFLDLQSEVFPSVFN
jgi:hypothetical protein